MIRTHPREKGSSPDLTPSLSNTLLLLALPASGKSEIRKYLNTLSNRDRLEEFNLGRLVQLDDFPYVHRMRRIDEELTRLGKETIFFPSPDKPFKNPWDWGTLDHLLNEDYEDLLSKRIVQPQSASLHLFERLDRAGQKVGIKPRLAQLGETRQTLAKALENESNKFLQDKQKNYPETLEGTTLVLEFARGGRVGSKMPLAAPFGYGYSLSQLSPALLEKASILYVWVTPEESRRKNEERKDPNDLGSILHHSVPVDVMLNDYGSDDIEWLEKNSQPPGAITIEANGKVFSLPCARFDNRADKTSFLRKDSKTWKASEIETVHGELKQALNKLHELCRLPCPGSRLYN